MIACASIYQNFLTSITSPEYNSSLISLSFLFSKKGRETWLLTNSQKLMRRFEEYQYDVFTIFNIIIMLILFCLLWKRRGYNIHIHMQYTQYIIVYIPIAIDTVCSTIHIYNDRRARSVYNMYNCIYIYS